MPWPLAQLSARLCTLSAESAQVLTRAGLVVLLFGTVVGDLCQLSSVGLRAVHQFYGPGGAPAWLVASEGRVLMLLLTGAIVAPLCCLRR